MQSQGTAGRLGAGMTYNSTRRCCFRKDGSADAEPDNGILSWPRAMDGWKVSSSACVEAWQMCMRVWR